MSHLTKLQTDAILKAQGADGHSPKNEDVSDMLCISREDASQFVIDQLVLNRVPLTPDLDALQKAKRAVIRRMKPTRSDTSKSDPSLNTFEKKDSDVKALLIWLFGTWLMEQKLGRPVAIYIRSNTNAELHYVSDALQVLIARDIIEVVKGAEKGVKPTAYRVVLIDEILEPLVTLVTKSGLNS
jgi:hypothetical protein